VHARLVRRHPEHAEKGRKPNLPADAAPDAVRQLPVDPVGLLAEGDAPRARRHVVDPDHECLPAPDAPQFDRAGERVTGVELGVGPVDVLVAADRPAGVRRRDGDAVAGIDRQHRLELAGEVPVQHRCVERQPVQRH
jgi:hypothetical protein